ncbi:MAG: hypothetical protein ACLVKR_07265 [Lachnospiraceae bacterium]
MDKKELTAVYDISYISEKSRRKYESASSVNFIPFSAIYTITENKTMKDGNNAKYDPSMALYSYAVIV